MKNQTFSKINFILGGLVLLSLLLFPDITVKLGLPKIKFIDILFPFIITVLFVQRKSINWRLTYKIILAFCAYILFVVIFNGRYAIVRDYFELYKILKFLSVIILFTLIEHEKFLRFWIKPIFVVVVLGNIIHYFEWLGLNPILEKHYDGGIHIQLFGLNYAGQPDMKRMVGFAGNPNINAIVFGFFSILFFPNLHKPKSQFVWFFVAILMFFLCQSRTNFIALTASMIFVFIWFRNQLKFNFVLLGVVLVAFLISFWVSTNSYINLLFEKKIVQNSSLLARIDIWKMLWEMIKEKPFFGHGPNKEFFYERDLYAENEFILQTWRYGFVGLFIFLGILLTPLFSALKNKLTSCSFELILFTGFILVNSLTNTPFTNPIINILFAIVIGLYFANLKPQKSL